jgi:hypothetical protein
MSGKYNVLSLADCVGQTRVDAIIFTGMFLATSSEVKKYVSDGQRPRQIFNDMVHDRLVTPEAHTFLIECDSVR